MKDKQNRQLRFVLVLLVVMAVVALYLFLTGRGVDLNNIGFFRKTATVVPANENEYPHLIKLTSKAFENEGSIPAKYTCSGESVNPPFTISGVPTGAKSLVLIVDDPDAPYKVWTHWIVFNIGPRTTQVFEDGVPWGSVLGESDFGVGEYRGPCPPLGKHRYFFRLYALDIRLDFEKGSNRQQIEEGMKGHILDEGELIGTFEK